ncbi:TetR/AcrR family transcriptional regulator [uncultured Algimonas sp.]|uniref:TetR/AcrR family transcriptional regulator n=1 Tax=uncultured Algimonas sp. TaxID=1547920 RepID=UPI00262B6351|nr:TetR/AcrR family transcriptional regulator [uncultured Algimonas sp.]
MTLRARTPKAKSDRERLLLSAALNVFFSKGFQAARMQDIAEEAGLSKGTVYIYFGSKEEVFQALIDTLAKPNVEHIQTLLQTAPTVTQGLRMMNGFARQLIVETDMPKFLKVLVGESQLFPEIVADYHAEVINPTLQLMERRLDEVVDSGELAVPDTHIAARQIMTPVIFSGLWESVFSKTQTLDYAALLSAHVEALLCAWAPKDTTS